ncbi:MAG: AMP-binding protein, partial [Caldilineaceae bacterium]|nr:AMP-binding protein [Caldilineaceae bacterium]
MTIASETLLHQQAIQGRCFHPDTVWEEFPHAALEQSVVTRFEAMVVRYPDHLAVNMGDRCLTYTQLNSTANRVAHALLEHQGSGAEPIALLFEHGIDMIGALLGVLKAGKFYVPLNPDEPLSRLQTMVADTEAQVLLTNCRNRELAHTLSGTNLWPLEMETLDLTGPYPNPTLAIDIDAFAYLIYTSGSTGQPKGVIETHRNVLHFVWNHSNTEHYVPSDRCGLTRAYTFSGTASLLYSALLNGAAIALYDVVQQGIAGLANWFATDGITAVSLAPTIFRQFVGYVPQGEQFPALRLLRLGGDRVLPSDLDLYQRHFSANCIFQFGLGTSEVKVLTNYFVDHNTEFTEETVPAGYPVADIELLVLDEGGNELGFDQIGEIAVRSRYISPGYWRQPALTAARFLPVANDPTKHIYLTGDLGKLRADGCLFHVGRNDAQV